MNSKMNFYLWWIILFLTLFPVVGQAEDAVRIIKLEVLDDVNRNLRIDDISSSSYRDQFKELHNHRDFVINSHQASWLKLEVVQRFRENFYLMVENIGINERESVKVFIESDGVYDEVVRLYDHAFPAFKINAVSTNTTVYMRFNNFSNYSLSAPLKAVTSIGFQHKIRDEYLLFGGILFGLALLAIYNFILFFSMRQRSYLIISSILLLCVIMLNRSSNVIAFFSIFSEEYFYFYSLPISLLFILILDYCRGLLRFNENLPLGDRVINIIIVINIIAMPFMGLLPFFEQIIQLEMLASIIIFPFVFSKMALAGDVVARLMLVLMSSIVLTACPVILGGLDFIVTSDFVIKLYLIGVLVFALSISLIQTVHTNLLRRQAEKAEAENQAKDEFLNVVSHELRTPMHAVISAGELLLTTSLSSRQQPYVEKLVVSSRHAISLIEDMLNLARLEVYAYSHRKEHFKLSDLLQDLRILFQESTPDNSVELIIDNQLDDSLQIFHADQKSLKQVFINLIFNAIKFTDYGYVKVSCEKIHGHDGDKSLTVLFKVEDTGVGILEGEQDKVFQTFYKGSKQAKYHEGSGLGLVISKKLVELMGGDLQFTSKPGLGTTFFFTLELRAGNKHELAEDTKFSASEQTNRIEADYSSARVLIVDDNEVNRFFTSELLKNKGFELFSVDSGVKALNFIEGRRHQIDLILMDISMPEMNGFELAEKIRKNYSFNELPIVALTAHVSSKEQQTCRSLGVNDYMSKPFKVDELIRKIHFWYEKTRVYADNQ